MAPVGLPDTVHVKVSSEDAAYVSFTAVVAREMPIGELVEAMLGISGRDAGRIAELLRRGSLVSGASRLRWNGFEASPADIAALLETLPGPDPTRPFDASLATSVVLSGGGARIEIDRDAASKRRAFHRRSFWEVLMEAVHSAAARYVDYSYKHRADVYAVRISAAAAARLRENAGLLAYSALEDGIRHMAVSEIEFTVPRQHFPAAR